MNKAAVDKTTREESMTAKPDNPDTAKTVASTQEESTLGDTQIIDLSAEEMETLQTPMPIETSNQVDKVNSEQSDNKTNDEEQMAVKQQPKASIPEKPVQDTAPPTALPKVQPTTTADTPEANVAPPAKRPFIDITPYLRLMVEREGSDMYFTSGAKVQIKIEGVSLSIGSNVLPKGTVNDILPGILNQRQLAEFEEEMELDTAFSLDNVGRFRINVFRQRGEVALVIRQIKAKIPTVADLQLPPVIESLIMEPRGLLIIAGATGTGKSTTVASMIDYRNTRKSGHILTIEDPIEFIHDHKKSIVNQREVGLDTKSFKEALRRAMREAPDVIMIGEIRDAETMQQALSYADTGHLCIATLHATNATQCMERIIGLFPETNRNQLLMDISQNLRAIICQRLLIDVNKKRVPATEVLFNEPQVKKLIQDGGIHKLKEVLEKAPPESPLHSFDNDMLRLYQSKKITMEEALNHADEPNHFKLKVNLGGGGISSTGDDIYSS